MRLLWRRWCRHHLLKTSTSTRPRASWVVSFSGSRYIFLILIHDLIFVCLLPALSNAYQKFRNTQPYSSTYIQHYMHQCLIDSFNITANVCCSSMFICRLKLLSLHWSKGLQLLLMRHLQRLPPSYCQPHLLDAYISSSPRTSRAVTIQGFRYIFLSHIYMPWFMSDIITGSV